MVITDINVSKLDFPDSAVDAVDANHATAAADRVRHSRLVRRFTWTAGIKEVKILFEG